LVLSLLRLIVFAVDPFGKAHAALRSLRLQVLEKSGVRTP
jgi:hypothetical protein